MSAKRTAIVTGSARGIGKAIALKLAKNGCTIANSKVFENITANPLVDDVTICDLPSMKAEAEATAAEVGKLGVKTHVAFGDVSKRVEVEKVVSSHVQNLGNLFTMVANAGICQVKPAIELTEEEFERMFQVNVFEVFNCYQVAGKQMIKQGTHGRLIGCASIVSYKPFALLTHYSASKFAVRGITQSMALELAPHWIRVNAYCPGIHDTQIWVEVDEGLGKAQGRPKGESIKKYCDDLIALKRCGTPEDVAKLVGFLASDEAEHITGQSILVDGGIILT